MIPKFQIIDFNNENENELNIKVVVIDDPKFLGYIFNFNKINFDYQSDGVGVSYDLDINLHKEYVGNTKTKEQTDEIKAIAHEILKKIISDFIELHNSGELDNAEISC